MRFVCDSCRAQYMISDEKVGAKGVKVRCKKCGHVILVRRPQDVASAAPPPPPPDDGSDATQVMQNPLQPGATLGGADPETTAPGGNPTAGGKPNGLLAGIADDEIGAVFDQVLSGGSNKSDAGEDGRNGSAVGDDPDDRMSTRVLDAETVKKLAEEAAHGEDTAAALNGTSKNGHDKAPPADHDWFVAIDEKQVGPLKLDQVKERWDQGEIGPDSLCWRAGFSDWMPLSDIDELASVLAPQPRKPVIVASTSMDPGIGAMMSVESAFSADGISRTVRSEVPVMAAGAGAQEDGGWKPSAASALASLVKEEIEALARPPTEKAPPPPAAAIPSADEKHSVRGILDLPSQEHRVPKDVAVGPQVASISQVRLPEPAPAPAAQPGFAPAPYGAAPYATQYTPPRNNKGLLIVGGGVVALLVVMLGLVAFLVVDRGNQGGGAQVAQPDQTVTPPVAVAKGETAAPAAAAKPAEPMKAEKGDKAEAQPAKGEEVKTPAPAVAREPTSEKEQDEPKKPQRVASARPPPERAPAPEPETRRESTPSASDPENIDEDDFLKEFGGGNKPKKTAQAKPAERNVYVPPAPGAATIPDRLGQSDIMQVVLSNKAAIVRCVDEQKKKDPGVNGKLVMRWTVRTNGRTSNVSCQTPEFKSTVMAACIGGLIKGWKFPQHKVQGEPIDFPFTF